MGPSNRPHEPADSADLDGVRRVLDAFESDVWDEVHLVTGDWEIHLRRDGAGPTDTPTAPPRHRVLSASAEGAPDRASGDATADVPAITVAEPESTEGLVEITAPSVGIFWAQPQPGAPPFVSVDDVVEPNSTVCIIEVMKLMNHVKASIHGRIVRVLGVNGQAVERGEALFLVEPAST